MKKTLFLVSLFTLKSTVFAVISPEVLYVDNEDAKERTFLVSNSTHDAGIRIVNNTKERSALLECEGQRNKRISFYRPRLQRKPQVRLRVSEKEIVIPKSANKCKLSFGDQKVVNLVKDEVAHPVLKDLNHYQEKCNFEKRDNNTLDSVFYTNKYPAMGCIHKIEKVELLPKSEDGLLSKMEILLGYKPDSSFINNQDPYAELDFSKAPKFDAIFLSTLLYRHDFTGAVMARLIKFHAKRGTVINIIGTGYMHGDNEKALLKELSKYSENIRVQEYKYHEENFFKKFNVLTNYLRDMHIKAFVTLSKDSPKDNVMIIGGRNIHDGFVFSEKPLLKQYKNLSQIGEEEQWAYWQDLEVKITSKGFAKSLFAHLLKFWNRKVHNQKMDNFLVTEKGMKNQEFENEQGDIDVRHIISLPFNDDSALEDLYVRLIKNAKKTIKIASPYLRPTPKIMKALQNALKKNPKLDVVVQTRISLEGDTQAWLYEETNKAAINKIFDKVRVYEWLEKSILHSKLLVVDDEYVVIGSVNLSRRSFIQDVENALFIKNESFAMELSRLIEDYNSKSKRITKEQGRKFWASVVVKLLENQF